MRINSAWFFFLYNFPETLDKQREIGGEAFIAKKQGGKPNEKLYPTCQRAKGYPSLFPLRFSVIVKRHHKRTFVCLSRFRAHRNLFGKLRNRPIHRFLRRRRIFRERQFLNCAHQFFQKFHLNRRRRRFFFVHVFLDILEDREKVSFTDTTTENASLKKEVLELQSKLDTTKRGSVQKKLDDAQLLNDYRELRRIVERIPPEILERAKRQERSAAASRCMR